MVHDDCLTYHFKLKTKQRDTQRYLKHSLQKKGLLMPRTQSKQYQGRNAERKSASQPTISAEDQLIGRDRVRE
jgi:hypothetical protein